MVGQSSLSTLLEMISFDRSHTSSYLHSIVTKATSCIVSKIKQHIGGKSEFFIPPSTPQSHGEKAGNIFALFFFSTEPDHWPIRWCKWTLQKVLYLLSVHTHYRQIDGNVISVVEHVLVSLAIKPLANLEELHLHITN